MAGRGRPSKNKTETKQENTIDFEKILADALAKQEEKLRLEFESKLMGKKEEAKNEVVKEKKGFLNRNKRLGSRDRKFVPDDARVRVELNIGGKFIIADTRGNAYFIELNGYKDSTTIAYRDLKNFHGTNHSFLNSGKIIITDVITESDIDVYDVIEDLNLSRLYNNEDIIRPFEIEEYLSEDIDIKEFSEKIEKSNDYLEVIIEVSVLLFKKGEFSDNSKMNKIREVARMPELFTK
jgi:hypothetical protein